MMAPQVRSRQGRQDQEEDSFQFEKPIIFNALNKGLCTYTKQGVLVNLADVSLWMMAPIAGSPPGYKGYLWKIRFEKSEVVTSIMVPKNFHLVSK